jgi:hypothetical protein
MADRPTPPEGAEIEVTPEMIEAGLNAYSDWYATPAGDTGPMGPMVEAVFRAMLKRWYIRVSSTPRVDQYIWLR